MTAPDNVVHGGQHGYVLLPSDKLGPTGETRDNLTWWLSGSCAGLDKGCDMIPSADVLVEIPREYGDGVPFPWFQPVIPTPTVPTVPTIPTVPTVPVDPGPGPDVPTHETPEPATGLLLCGALLMAAGWRKFRGRV